MSTTHNYQDQTYNRQGEDLAKPGVGDAGLRSNDKIQKPIDWDLVNNPSGTSGRTGTHSNRVGDDYSGDRRNDLDRTTGQQGTYGLTGRGGPGNDGGIGQPQDEGILGREADNATDLKRTGGDYGKMRETGLGTGERGRHHRQGDIPGGTTMGGVGHHTTEHGGHHRTDDTTGHRVQGSDRYPTNERGRDQHFDDTTGHEYGFGTNTGVPGEHHRAREGERHNVLGGGGGNTGYEADSDYRHGNTHGDTTAPGYGADTRGEHQNTATHDKVGLGDKIKGTLEQVGGKITKNPIMEERGIQRKTEGSTIDPAQRF
ncbi:hypothetical protein FRC03_005311 [Tulasnella sp. 419]|nr:hypothetical protein FRC03_005311 [Tulasnella sp. 419]